MIVKKPGSRLITGWRQAALAKTSSSRKFRPKPTEKTTPAVAPRELAKAD
jgi:hypothetical protein